MAGQDPDAAHILALESGGAGSSLTDLIGDTAPVLKSGTYDPKRVMTEFRLLL